MRTVAIIQARMGSLRLPGKVLMDLCGKPVLWHIVKRLKQCSNLNDIVVATSTTEADTTIVKFCKRYKIKFFRGSESDVLRRYIDAADNFKADYIVRITGDAPLIEPREIDRFIKVMTGKGADYFVEDPDVFSIHEGFSVVSLSILKKVYRLSDIRDYHKEHVTIYLKEHPEFGKTVCFKPAKVFQKAGYRLSIDNMADFKFMEGIYKRFWDRKNIVDLKKIIRFLEKNPHLKSINAHVLQKKPEDKSRKVLFIIDGGPDLGFGHFMRATLIAKYLVENKNCGVLFVTNNHLLNKKIIEFGFECFLFASEDFNPKHIWQVIKKQKPHIMVIDIKNSHNPASIIKLVKRENKDLKIILIDNATNARLLADKNIYPVPRNLVSGFKWRDYKGKVCSGLKFFPLKEGFTKVKKIKRDNNTVIISMGASDPHNITLFVMKDLISTGKKAKVIVGPGFKSKKEIRQIARQHKDIFELYENPDNYAKIASSASLAVTALGISVYEFSYLKIPVIVIGNYVDDLKTGKSLEKLGYCKYAGYYKDINVKKLSKMIERGVKFKDFKEKCGKKGVASIACAILN